MPRNTQELLLRISGQIDAAFGKSFKASTGQVYELGAKLADAASNVERLNRIVQQRRGVDTMTQRLAKAQQRVAELSDAMQKAQTPNVRLQRSYAAAQKQAVRYAGEVKRLSSALRTEEQAAGIVGMRTAALSKVRRSAVLETSAQLRAVEKLAVRQKAAAEDAAAAAERCRNGFFSLVEGVMAFKALSAPVQAAVDFEVKTKELAKYTDQADALMKLNQEASLSSAIAASDMADIQAAALQAGVVDANNVKQIQEYTATVNDAAIAFGITGEAAGSAFATIQAQIAGNIEGTKEMFDVVNAISNATNASAEDLLTVIQRSGGIVKNFTALSLPQITALSAAFRAASTSAEEAATAQAAFIAALTKGKGATNTQLQGFEALGINVQKLTEQLLAGPEQAQAAINQLLGAIKQLDETKRADVMSKIFGGDKGTLNAIASILGQTDALLTKPQNIAADRSNYDGSMAQEAAIQASTVANQQKILANNFAALKVIIGQDLLPLWNDVLSFIISATQGFSRLAASSKLVAYSLLGMIGGFALVKIALGAGAIIINAIRSAYNGVRLAVLGFNQAMLIAKGSIVATSKLMKILALVLKGPIKLFHGLRIATLAAASGMRLAALASLNFGKKAIVAAAIGAKSAALAFKRLTLAALAFAWQGAKSMTAALARATLALFAFGKAQLMVAVRFKRLLVASLLFAAQGLKNMIMSLGRGVVQLGAFAAAQAAAALKVGAVTKVMRIFNLTLLANPIGIVIAAIAGLIAAGVWLYRNWDTVKAKAAELWGSFKENFPFAAEVVSNAFDIISGTVGFILKALSGLIDWVGLIFTGQWDEAWQQVKNLFGAAFDGLIELAKKPLNWISDKLSGVVDTIASAFSKVGNFFTGKKTELDVSATQRQMQTVMVQQAAFDPALAGAAAVSVPALAQGGIVTAPTFAQIGEGSESEAVLPLSKLDALLRLPSRQAASAQTAITVNFNPSINLQGDSHSGAGADPYREVKRALNEGSRDLRRELTQLLHDEGRLSYA